MYGREVRDCIRLLRQCGEPITIGASGIGYIHLEDQHDDHAHAVLVKAHRERTRSYLIDAAALMRQIGKMTATEAAQACLFDLLVPSIEGAESDRPVTMADLARLPDPKYRAGVLALMMKFLDGLAEDPVAFRAERAAIADKYGGMFVSRKDAETLRASKNLWPA